MEITYFTVKLSKYGDDQSNFYRSYYENVNVAVNVSQEY